VALPMTMATGNHARAVTINTHYWAVLPEDACVGRIEGASIPIAVNIPMRGLSATVTRGRRIVQDGSN
jgi:hypothetical protein